MSHVESTGATTSISFHTYQNNLKRAAAGLTQCSNSDVTLADDFPENNFFCAKKIWAQRAKPFLATNLKSACLPLTELPKNAYGSVSAGREKWPFNVLFFFKVEAPCEQTW